MPRKCATCGMVNHPMRQDDRNQVACNDCFQRWRIFDEKERKRWKIMAEGFWTTNGELAAAVDELDELADRFALLGQPELAQILLGASMARIADEDGPFRSGAEMLAAAQRVINAAP